MKANTHSASAVTLPPESFLTGRGLMPPSGMRQNSGIKVKMLKYIYPKITNIHTVQDFIHLP